MLSLALSYAARSWPCFPCRAQEEIDDFGEIHSEKTPYTSNGLKGASLNERIIREWWKRTPGAVVGVPTGSKIDAWVLDVDNKPGGANGFEWLADMEAEHGPLPETLRVKSPNGGVHYFFRYVAGTRNRGALGAGVDVRSEGGYVIAAGSVLADGRAYVAENDAPIADAPAWLLELVLPRPAPANANYRPYDGGNSAYVNRAVDAELADLASTPQGGRNNALNDAAFALGQFVGAGALSEHDAREALESIASQWSNFPLSRRTITNGLTAGMRNPRSIPVPEAPSNDNTRLVDISRMIENGLRKAESAKQAASQDYTQERIKSEYTDERIAANEPANHADESALKAEIPIQSLDSEPAKQPNGDNATQHVDVPPVGDKPAILATPFNWIDPKTLPRRSFAFGSHYIRKYVSVTGAPGGLGKTANSIVETLAMASGRSLTGTKPDKRLRVWLFNMEDPRDELERRIMAAAIHYKLRPEDIEQHLFLDTGREQELVIAREDKRSGVKVVEPIVEAVTAQIKSNGIDVMIVDPFVSTHAVNENDNGAIDKVAKLWAHIADKTNCAIDVVHHLRKVSDREATVEDMRGAVALIGAARSVRILNRMTDEQATKAGVDDRLGYFSITYGKANLTPLSSRLDWRRLESVPLGNGRGLMKPQDFAPVVAEWTWPDSEQMLDKIPADVAELVRVRLANQNYRDSDQSEDWAGYAIADIMGDDLPHTKGMTPLKKKYKQIIEAWKKTGFLVTEKDGTGKRPVVLLRPNTTSI